MDNNQNDNLFDNDVPAPQQPDQPAEGAARVYQTPPPMANPSPEEPRPYVAPPVSGPPPPKKNNTPLIIAIVVIVLLCCCCLGIAAIGWFYGDTIFSDFNFSLLPVLNLAA